jgi:signal transduction histidine kinase
MRLRSRWGALPVEARDGAIAAALVVFVGVDRAFTSPADRAPLVATLVSVVATATLTWRRARPAVPLVATGVAVGLGAFLPGAGAGALLGALVAVYSAVAWWRRGPALAIAALECALVAVGAARDSSEQTTAVVGLVAAMYVIAVALALAASARRAAIEAVRDRAERAEATREVEASRRVAEERLRIARELHDVIGHHVAVVGVQAAVASRLLDTKPDAARTALEHVQDASEAVLAELGSLVRVLRDPGEAAPDGPAAGLDALDRLLDEARSAGLELTATTVGARRPVPPVLDLAAYRIIQESLTNARKHGAGVVIRSKSSGCTLKPARGLPSGVEPACCSSLLSCHRGLALRFEAFPGERALVEVLAEQVQESEAGLRIEVQCPVAHDGVGVQVDGAGIGCDLGEVDVLEVATTFDVAEPPPGAGVTKCGLTQPADTEIVHGERVGDAGDPVGDMSFNDARLADEALERGLVEDDRPRRADDQIELVGEREDLLVDTLQTFSPDGEQPAGLGRQPWVGAPDERGPAATRAHADRVEADAGIKLSRADRWEVTDMQDGRPQFGEFVQRRLVFEEVVLPGL